MALTILSSTATIGTSARSIVGDTTTSVPLASTTEAKVRVRLDCTAVVAGDEFTLTYYTKVDGGTQRTGDVVRLVGPLGVVDLPEVWLSDGWDITLVKVGTTDRSIRWTVAMDAREMTILSSAATIGTAERSIIGDTTTSVPLASGAAVKLRARLDCTAVVAGDVFRVLAYTKVDSATVSPAATQRVQESLEIVGPAGLVEIPELWLSDGWDITIHKISGTDRAIRWTVYEDVVATGGASAGFLWARIVNA